MVSAQKTKLLLLVFLILVLISPAVMAQTVTFADPDSVMNNDVLLYNSTGHLLGTFNTTTNDIPLPDSGDVIFVFKPQYSNPLDNPADFADSLYSWFSTNLIFLISIGAVAALIFRKW